MTSTNLWHSTKTAVGPSRELVEALRSGPFELAVKLAVRDSGLSLDRIENRLSGQGIRVSASTLSNWQTGRSRPERAESLRALRAVERLLGLAPDSLVRLVGPKRPRGRWIKHVPGSVPNRRLFNGHRPTVDLLDDVDYDDSAFRLVTVDETVLVDRHRRIRAIQVRELITAVADGVDRCWAYYHADDDRLPIIVPARDTHVSRSRTDPASGMSIAELRLDQPLNRDESRLVEFDFRFDPSRTTQDAPGDHYYRVFRQPCPHYLLRVRFDRGATPIRCVGIGAKQVGVPFTDDLPLRAVPSRTATRYVAHNTPGIVGIRWDWR